MQSGYDWSQYGAAEHRAAGSDSLLTGNFPPVRLLTQGGGRCIGADASWRLIGVPLAIYVHRGDAPGWSGEEGGVGGDPLSFLATAEGSAPNAIRVVWSLPALQFRAFLPGRRHREHDEAVMPTVQGPGRSSPCDLSHGGLLAPHSVSQTHQKACRQSVTRRRRSKPEMQQQNPRARGSRISRCGIGRRDRLHRLRFARQSSRHFGSRWRSP